MEQSRENDLPADSDRINLDFSQAPIQEIVPSNFKPLSGKQEGNYWVIRTRITPGAPENEQDTMIRFRGGGTLRFSDDDGKSWRVIGSIFNGTKNYYRYFLEFAVLIRRGAIYQFAVERPTAGLELRARKPLDDLMVGACANTLWATPVIGATDMSAEFVATHRAPEPAGQIFVRVTIDNRTFENLNNNASYVHIPNAYEEGPTDGEHVLLNSNARIVVSGWSVNGGTEDIGFTMRPSI